jgi:murein DD-endopeptidase MepM/ murein hydrolase activator NlpD
MDLAEVRMELLGDGSATRVEAPAGVSFRQLSDAVELPWMDLFRAYRAGGRRVLRTCPLDPSQTAEALEFLVVPGAIQGPQGSFFERMPLDTWRIPEDGRWAVPRSGGRRKHKGLDLHAPEGSPVYAVAGGWVYRAWTVKPLRLDGGYGNYVILEHPDAETSGQRYWTYYTHMKDPPEVREGEWVPAGYRLGSVGRTPIGRFTNPHLHFEVRHSDGSELGKPVNPTPFGPFRFGPFRQSFTAEEGAF